MKLGSRASSPLSTHDRGAVAGADGALRTLCALSAFAVGPVIHRWKLCRVVAVADLSPPSSEKSCWAQGGIAVPRVPSVSLRVSFRRSQPLAWGHRVPSWASDMLAFRQATDCVTLLHLKGHGDRRDRESLEL